MVLADSGVISPLGPNPVSRSASSQILSALCCRQTFVFGKRIPHDVDVSGHPLLILSLALSLTLSDFPPTVHPCRKPPSQQKYCSHRQCPDRLSAGHLRPGEKPANNPLCRLAGMRFILLMSLAIFCRKSFAVFFPAPLSAGQGQKSNRQHCSYLLNKTLQLLAINKTERAEIASMPPHPALISGSVMEIS